MRKIGPVGTIKHHDIHLPGNMNKRQQGLLLCGFVYQECNEYTASALSMSTKINNSSKIAKRSSRRSFISQALTTAGVAGVTSPSWLTSPATFGGSGDHSENCACDGCRGLFGVQPANAIEATQGKESGKREKKEVAIEFAFAKQAEETNARLAKNGFPLDTKAEESAKIQEGLASLSYEDVMGLKKTKGVNKGYGNR